jgi:ubiquinone biosynthesis protein
MHLVLKYQIRLPRNLLLLLKTFIQTEALGKILGSDASLLEVTKPYAKKLLQRGYDARKLMKNLGHDARLMGHYLKQMPGYLHDILRQTAQGRQRLEFHHSGFEKLDAQLERGVNRLTVGIVIAASIVAAALILNSGREVLIVSTRISWLPSISLTSVLGLAGYFIATILGLWLILSILRSRRL